MTKTKTYADIVVIGNGTAAAGAVHALNRHIIESGSGLTVLVLEAKTKEDIAGQIPELNARVTFPYEMAEQFPGIEKTVINTYNRTAFYSPRAKAVKNLPPGRVSLVDTDKLVTLLESNLQPSIRIKHNKQVCNAAYVDYDGRKLIKLTMEYPFKDEKVFETTDEVYARAVIDCSGTGSVMLDKMQGYRHDSDIVCGVLAFKVINAKIPDNKEVSLGLDDKMSHGAGIWAYHNGGQISSELKTYLEKWFANTQNKKILDMISGKTADDFAGTISDVGVSSISAYARAQHYRSNLERQAEDIFSNFAIYRDMFRGAAVIPGSAFYKPSPVLQPVSKMAGEGYILVGDSAGHATPYIGEGIRPGIDMGLAAGRIIFEAIADNDLSEKRLKNEFEKVWWNKYGKYDIWSDLFRHFSSTCFTNKEWDSFFGRIQDKLTDEDFYKVLKSEYNVDIAWKMFDWRMATHYLSYKLREGLDFFRNKATLRQAVSWIE